MAEEHKTTREKKCTECGSENVEFQGLSHAIGIGEKISKVRHFQFKCVDCDALFSYEGEKP